MVRIVQEADSSDVQMIDDDNDDDAVGVVALGARELAVMESLQGVGLQVRPHWLRQVVARAPPSSNNDNKALEHFVFEQALYSDLRVAGDGTLPAQISTLHKHTVQGKHFLQVEEVVNVGESAEFRQADSRNRTLKLLLTDGRQNLYGMEFKHIRDLSVHSYAGLKVMAHNFEVRRGIALFGPHNLHVLGGMYADLEKKRLENNERIERARKRLQLVPEILQNEDPEMDGDERNRSQSQQANPRQNVGSSGSNSGGVHRPEVSPSSSLSGRLRLGGAMPNAQSSSERQRAPEPRNQPPPQVREHRENMPAECQPERQEPESSIPQMRPQANRPLPPASNRQVFVDPEIGEYEEVIDDVEDDPAYGIMLDDDNHERSSHAPTPRREANPGQGQGKSSPGRSDGPGGGGGGEPIQDNSQRSGIVNCEQQQPSSFQPAPRARDPELEKPVCHHLVDMHKWSAEPGDTFRVKVAVTSACKFRCNGGVFSLETSISDGSGVADVCFSDSLLQHYGGITPEEYGAMEKDKKKKFKNVLALKLVNLQGIMTLEITDMGPQAIALEDGSGDAYALLERAAAIVAAM